MQHNHNQKTAVTFYFPVKSSYTDFSLLIYLFTLTIVICSAHNKDILEKRDQSEGVYDQRERSNYILRVINSMRKCVIEHI